MKLDELADGSLYVDTNILYMYLRADPAHLQTLTTFFSRVVHGAIEAFVGIPVLDELFYRLLARVRDATGRHPLEVWRADLAGVIAAHSDAIDTALRKLVALPHVHLVGVETADFSSMLDNIKTYGLLPRDALHVTLMQRLGLTAVASDDTDFDRVTAVTRHWAINPPANTQATATESGRMALEGANTLC
jgi:predicted nucleic acid-binding protein